MKLLEIKKNQKQKAGFIPYIVVDGEVQFMFMIPSDSKFGGDKPSVAKGAIDPGETPKIAGLREAKEELGLKSTNLVGPVKLGWKGTITGMVEVSTLSVFFGEVKSKDDFDKPHFETKSVHWLTANEFKRVGRTSQQHIVEIISSKINK